MEPDGKSDRLSQPTGTTFIPGTGGKVELQGRLKCPSDPSDRNARTMVKRESALRRMSTLAGKAARIGLLAFAMVCLIMRLRHYDVSSCIEYLPFVQQIRGFLQV